MRLHHTSGTRRESLEGSIDPRAKDIRPCTYNIFMNRLKCHMTCNCLHPYTSALSPSSIDIGPVTDVGRYVSTRCKRALTTIYIKMRKGTHVKKIYICIAQLAVAAARI